ncbi:MAG: polysaccharide deacetylase family protein [candidate division Zixibacteria bacterium]|nr:polysaccharide deacetylase family protein [candidate division Zixibacteria bacterium]
MPILVFHNISGNFPFGLNYYSPTRLKALLNFILSAGYTFISLADYVNSPESNARQISITFDDGYESFYRKAFPIMEDMSIPATVFIPGYYIGKLNHWDYSSLIHKTDHLTTDQIRKLSKAGIEIGSHGFTHLDLTGLSNRLLRLELERSKKGLEDLTGRRVHYISYPYGRFNRKVETMALEIGYLKGFSLSYLKKSYSGFSIPRFGIYIMDTPYSVSKKLGGDFANQIEKFKGAIINFYSLGNILLSRIRP